MITFTKRWPCFGSEQAFETTGESVGLGGPQFHKTGFYFSETSLMYAMTHAIGVSVDRNSPFIFLSLMCSLSRLLGETFCLTKVLFSLLKIWLFKYWKHWLTLYPDSLRDLNNGDTRARKHAIIDRWWSHVSRACFRHGGGPREQILQIRLLEYCNWRHSDHLS